MWACIPYSFCRKAISGNVCQILSFRVACHNFFAYVRIYIFKNYNFAEHDYAKLSGT